LISFKIDNIIFIYRGDHLINSGRLMDRKWVVLETSKEMSRKINCWDFVKCGREFGGEKVAVLDLCPSSIDISADGLNDGKNGGRICWAIAGTFCKEIIQGFFA